MPTFAPMSDTSSEPVSSTTQALEPEPPEAPGVSPAMLAALEDAECRAFVDMVESAPEALRRKLGLGVERRGGMTAIRSAGLENLMFNRLFVPPADVVPLEDLVALIRGYSTSGIGRYLVHVPPSPSTAAVLERLDAKGIRPFRRHWAKFVRGTEPARPAPTDLTIRPAERRDAEIYGSILTAAFRIADAAIPLMAGVIERPRWHVFVACDGAAVVAGGALFVDGSVANLAGAATLPSYQRRGAQGALLAARIEAARRVGAERICSETGVRIAGEANPSYRNMVRSGLRPVYRRLNYAPPGTTWAPA